MIRTAADLLRATDEHTIRQPVRWLNLALAGGFALGVRTVLLVLAIALASGTWRTAFHTVEDIGTTAANTTALWWWCLIAAVAFSSISIILARRLARRSTPYATVGFLLVSSIAGIGLHLLLIWNVDPQWTGDYLRYWEHAKKMVEGDRDPLIFNIYSQRALFFPYPIVKAFGADAVLAMKLANAIALLGIQLLAYDAMRILRGPQAAQALSVLLLAAPLPAYAILIPSHDLWGLFFFALAFWTCTRACRDVPHGPAAWARTLALAVAAALVIHCLELQRAMGNLFALVFVLAAAGHLFVARRSSAAGNPERKRAIFSLGLAIAVLLLQPMLGHFGRAAGWMEERAPQRRTQQAMKIAAHGGALGTARSEWYVRFAERFAEKSQEGIDASRDFTRSVVLSNFIHQPLGKLSHAAGHVPRMFEPGYPTDWNTTLANPTRIGPAVRSGLLLYANFFGVLLGVLAVVALLRAGTRAQLPPLALLTPIATVAAAALTLILLFENKPPNIFPVWLVWTLLVAWSMAPMPHEASTPLAAGAQRVAFSLLASVFVVTGCWVAGTLLFPESRGRILDDWNVRLEQAGTTQAKDWPETLAIAPPQVFERRHIASTRLAEWVFRDAKSDGERIQAHADSLYATLALPIPFERGDRAVMSQQLCDHYPDRDAFEFFAFAPYRNTKNAKAFRLDVTVDGQLRRSLPVPLPGNSVQLVRIDDAFADAGCHTVEITLNSNVTRNRPSWQAASHVEIWFPRLVSDRSPDGG